MRLAEFAGWLATQVFDVVGTFAGVQGADGGAVVDLQVGKTCFHDVPAKVWPLLKRSADVVYELFRYAALVGVSLLPWPRRR